MPTRRWKGATIDQVAMRAGVSIATVSRVLNGSPHRVSDETRRKVLAAAEDLEYRPNAVARSLIQGSTATLGVFIPDLSNPYYAAIVSGVEAAASAAGYAVLLCTTDRNLAKEQRYIRLLQEKRIEGVIFAGGFVASEDLDAFGQVGIPLATIGDRGVGGVTVEVDNAEATRVLTEHLLGLGHTRIAFVAGPRASLSSKARLEGFRAALRAHGAGAAGELVVHGDWRPQSGYRLAKELRARGEFTAVVAANDLMALGVLRALFEEGLRVPSDVSVAGHDDIPEASFSAPSLTTMGIPSEELGRYATETLIRVLEKGGSAARIVLQAELVPRESTGPAR